MAESISTEVSTFREPGFENGIVGDEPIERPEKGDTKLRKRVTEMSSIAPRERAAISNKQSLTLILACNVQSQRGKVACPL